MEDDTPAAPALMPRVTVIKAYSKGFACSAGPGTVCLFEKTEEKDNYRQIREIKVSTDSPSVNLQPQMVSGGPTVDTWCIHMSSHVVGLQCSRHGSRFNPV